jgi:hypothetical protein
VWGLIHGVGTNILFVAGVNMGSRAGAGLQSKSKLLNPDFPFIRGVRILTTLLLLYVAIVVQIQVRKSPARDTHADPRALTCTQAHKHAHTHWCTYEHTGTLAAIPLLQTPVHPPFHARPRWAFFGTRLNATERTRSTLICSSTVISYSKS